MVSSVSLNASTEAGGIKYVALTSSLRLDQLSLRSPGQRAANPDNRTQHPGSGCALRFGRYVTPFRSGRKLHAPRGVRAGQMFTLFRMLTAWVTLACAVSAPWGWLVGKTSGDIARPAYRLRQSKKDWCLAVERSFEPAATAN
jgi:hypothetical protein